MISADRSYYLIYTSFKLIFRIIYFTEIHENNFFMIFSLSIFTPFRIPIIFYLRHFVWLVDELLFVFLVLLKEVLERSVAFV